MSTDNTTVAFVGVGNAGTIVTSSDGTTMDTRTSGTTNNLTSVTYGNGLFVTVGDSGTILTSSDGKTWTERTSGTGYNLYGVTYGNGTFVAVGYAAIILASTDGSIWANSSVSNIGTNTLDKITYGTRLFATVGSRGVSWG